jgi:plastocyanin
MLRRDRSHSLFSLLAILSTAFCLALPLGAATLDVRVTDAKGAAVPDAVVYAMPVKLVPIGHKVATMDQKNRMFVPYVLPIQTGTWVEFPNSDDVRHQVYSLSPAKRFQLALYTGKPTYPLQFTTAGVVQLGCNIHEQMNAYIVVLDTPYFAKTDAGRTALTDLSAGQYTLRVWYPEMRIEPAPQKLTLNATDHQSISFVVGRK